MKTKSDNQVLQKFQPQLDQNYQDKLQIAKYTNLSDIEKSNFIQSSGLNKENICFLFDAKVQHLFDNSRIEYHTINYLDQKIDKNTYTIVYLMAERNGSKEFKRFRQMLKQLPSKYYTQLKQIYLYQASLKVKTGLWIKSLRKGNLWHKKTKCIDEVEDLLKIPNFQAKWMNLVPQPISPIEQIEPTQLIKQSQTPFGQNLTEQKQNQFGIPIILDYLLSYFVINTERFLKPDIFRKQGSINEEEQLYALLNNHNYECLNVVDDVRIVCTMVKRFFTSLPDPLIPQHIFKFICNQIVQITPETEIALLEEVFAKLPSLNRVLLTAMVSFLLTVGNYSEFNHMNMNNLAIVFAPCFMRAQTNDFSSLEQIGQSVRFLKILFDNFDKMFQNVTFKLFLQQKQAQSCSSTSSNSSTGIETMSKNQILSYSEDEIISELQQKQQ